jgi:hypothetical protein
MDLSFCFPSLLESSYPCRKVLYHSKWLQASSLFSTELYLSTGNIQPFPRRHFLSLASMWKQLGSLFSNYLSESQTPVCRIPPFQGSPQALPMMPWTPMEAPGTLHFFLTCGGKHIPSRYNPFTDL